MEKVVVTTGRKLDDGVGENGPADAPGVIHHHEIAECLLATVEPSWLPVSPPVPGEYSGIGGSVVPLDGEGHVVRRSKSRDPQAELPDVSDEPALDPRVAVETYAVPWLGSTDAKLELVECGAYTCPFCKKSETTLAEVRKAFPDLAIAWLEMPQSTPEAVLAAKASIAASRQDRFWPMHRALFEQQPRFDRESLVALAEGLDLDRARFLADLDDPEVARMVARHKRACVSAGATATPTFFVNGDMIRGELGVEYLQKNLAELAALDE